MTTQLDQAASALASARRVLDQHHAGIRPASRYGYATARDNARIAQSLFVDGGRGAEAVEALNAYLELNRLAVDIPIHPLPY